MDFATFFANYGLLILLAALLVFMFFSSRRRQQRNKTEQAEKQRQMVPGVRVLLQGGLYGTIVAYDPEDLDRPAEVELAPGTVIEVHSQAILRIAEPPAADVVPGDDLIEDGSDAEEVDDVDESDAAPEAERTGYTLNGNDIEALPGDDTDRDKKTED